MKLQDMDKATDDRIDGPILRCLRLIRLLCETEGDISIKEAAARLDIPASSTHRLLNALQHEGFVRKVHATQRYGAGVDLERMGTLLASRRGVRDAVRPYLKRIVDRSGEAAMFVAWLPSTRQVSIMAAINSPHPLRYEMVLYEPHPVAWGATGRSIFAFLDEAEQRSIADAAPASPGTGEPLPAWADLKPELDAIAAAGYVLTRGQKVQGAVGIGAPIRNAARQVIGSFCITIPEIRFDPRLELDLAEALIEETRGFSRQV